MAIANLACHLARTLRGPGRVYAEVRGHFYPAFKAAQPDKPRDQCAPGRVQYPMCHCRDYLQVRGHDCPAWAQDLGEQAGLGIAEPQLRAHSIRAWRRAQAAARRAMFYKDWCQRKGHCPAVACRVDREDCIRAEPQGYLTKAPRDVHWLEDRQRNLGTASRDR